ncbi:MAG: N-acetylmuramoyl-L-alanine amidase family protein [Huintestinicola sp.]
MNKFIRKTISAVLAAALSLSAVSALSASASAEWVKTDSGYSYKDDSTGKKLTGWQTIDGCKYYFDKNGTAVTGWKKVGDSKYYFLSSQKGKMATGWVKLNGSRYYFGKDGVMRTGLRKIGGKTYYFGTDGKMRQNVSVKIKGKVYKFGSDGVLKSSSSDSLTKPFKGLSWGMTMDEITEKLNMKYYSVSGLYLYNYSSANGTDCDYYICSEEYGLQSYGTMKAYSSANLKEMKQMFADAGWEYDCKLSENGVTGLYYKKDGLYGLVMYSKSTVMTMMLSDELSKEVSDGKTDILNTMSN